MCLGATQYASFQQSILELDQAFLCPPKIYHQDILGLPSPTNGDSGHTMIMMDLGPRLSCLLDSLANNGSNRP